LNVQDQNCNQVNWFDTGMNANDIGIGNEGDVWAAGTNGELYSYHYAENNYENVETPGNIVHVSVGKDGNPYVITQTGETFFQTCDKSWTQLPGCSTKLGIGRGGEIFKIGCDQREGGYGIYKLFCKNDCKGSKCFRFRKSNDPIGSKCFWFRISGSGVKITVAPDGWPYVVTDKGTILKYDGADWKVVEGFTAKDISVSNEGIVFALGNDNSIQKLLPDGNWTTICGQASAISSGPYSHLWIVDLENRVKTSSK